MNAATKNKVIGAVEIPARETFVNASEREFIRLPSVGTRCPITGLSRAALNAWILPTHANDFKPPVKSFVIRQPGAKTGIRVISYPSLREWILKHADTSQTIRKIEESHE